ncbi:MAG: carbohydrate ABC transporter permease [Eubacteriales bacterium]|nr:carbohydrate ABC transporter permease [Eubacteriales bacterium]
MTSVSKKKHSFGRNKRTKLANTILQILLLFVSAVYFYPIILMCINAVKSRREMALSVLTLPKKIIWSNIAYVFNDIDYLTLFRNTMVVTVIGVVGIVSISSIAAYMLSRRSTTRYAKVTRAVLIAPMLIPFQTFMVTLLKVMMGLHLTGSIWGLGIQYWGFGVPMAVFIYYNFMKTVPKEIDESAKIDGASTLRSFVSIIFPLLRPVTITIIVLNVMWIWNDFVLPLLMVNSRSSTRTLVLGAYGYIGQFVTQWDYALCAMAMAAIPSIIVFLILQKYIVDGVVAGSIKG